MAKALAMVLYQPTVRSRLHETGTTDDKLPPKWAFSEVPTWNQNEIKAMFSQIFDRIPSFY